MFKSLFMALVVALALSFGMFAATTAEATPVRPFHIEKGIVFVADLEQFADAFHTTPDVVFAAEIADVDEFTAFPTVQKGQEVIGAKLAIKTAGAEDAISQFHLTVIDETKLLQGQAAKAHLYAELDVFERATELYRHAPTCHGRHDGQTALLGTYKA